MPKCWKNSHLLLEGLLWEQPDRISPVWILWAGFSTHSSNMTHLVAAKSTGLLCPLYFDADIIRPSFHPSAFGGVWRVRGEADGCWQGLCHHRYPSGLSPSSQCAAPAVCSYHPASAGWCRLFPVPLSRSPSPCWRPSQLCSSLVLQGMSDCVTQPAWCRSLICSAFWSFMS